MTAIKGKQAPLVLAARPRKKPVTPVVLYICFATSHEEASGCGPDCETGERGKLTVETFKSTEGGLAQAVTMFSRFVRIVSSGDVMRIDVKVPSNAAPKRVVKLISPCPRALSLL